MKLLFVVNVDWFFMSHRLPIALAAIKNGYEVHLACGFTDQELILKSHGILLHPISLNRSTTGIFKELKVINQINNVVKEVNPDVIHLVTVKCVIYGGLIARYKDIGVKVASISGLGFTFIDKAYKTRILKFFITKLYKIALGSKNTKVIFQNRNDLQLFIDNKIIEECQGIIIKGSGVDLCHYKPEPEAPGQKIVMFLGRLLKDKGLIEFCSVAKLLKNSGEDYRFVIVGEIDEQNPNSITQEELNQYVHSGLVEHWGFSQHPAYTISQSHIMVLPSYREGLPKSLIEAAACGRVVITTDTPGCRDAINPNVSGLLVPVKSLKPLASAIKLLCTNDEMRLRMGARGREYAEECFSIDDVVNVHLTIYSGNE